MFKMIYLIILITYTLKINNLYGLSQNTKFANNWSNLLYGYNINKCYDIPKNMTLCYDIGYNKMVLPNYMLHERVEEASFSSQVWLKQLTCHDDSKRFLCSLYAPVCILNQRIKKIPPCYELCQSVKERCAVRLRVFGYTWPDIFSCSKFPRKGSEVCIEGHNAECQSKICKQSNNKTLLKGHLCRYRTILRAQIKFVNSTRKLIMFTKRSRILKSNSRDFFRLKLKVYVPCLMCESFGVNLTRLTRGYHYLVLGESEKIYGRNHFTVRALYKWKKFRPWKKWVRRIIRKPARYCLGNVPPEEKKYRGMDIMGRKRKPRYLRRRRKRYRKNP